MSKSSLFEVFLRLRPSENSNERFINIERDDDPAVSTGSAPTSSSAARHISIKPPADDRRKRTIETFEFTHVFEEGVSQQAVFDGIGVMSLVGGVLGKPRGDGEEGITVGRDALIATLGVTGSGKSHTILGSKSVPGITQLALAALFRATHGLRVEEQSSGPAGATKFQSICSSDVSEAQIVSANMFIDSVFGIEDRSRMSRAQTPMMESASFLSLASMPSSKRGPPRPSTFAPLPTFESDDLPQVDSDAEYAICISMFEVYNDRIFDLLSSPTQSLSSGRGTSTAAHLLKRRALLFKSTELSPDRKVVAGLRKVVCSTLEEALIVLEIGLTERKVAGTGSNAVSSRSHGFFSIEVKKRERSTRGVGAWIGTGLTIVDLAGSERARHAKTAGATLAEAGKINESLMYLGRCMQMQGDAESKTVVPFRQCKLTELLFSNSFPNQSQNHHHQTSNAAFVQPHRNPQKAIMIVTADPKGDYNATCQILRYSALAREVAVPRVPSVNSQVPLLPPQRTDRLRPGSGRLSPDPGSLQDRIGLLTQQLADEITRREEAEETIAVLSDRLDFLEEEIRDEMAEEMEERVEAERRRWMGAWDEEADRREEWMDKKVELVMMNHANGTDSEGDQTPTASRPGVGQVGKPLSMSERRRLTALEDENKALQKRIDELEMEVKSRQDRSSRSVDQSRKSDDDSPPSESQRGVKSGSRTTKVGTGAEQAAPPTSGRTSPAKPRIPASPRKQRVLKAKKWQVDGEGDEF